MSDGLLLGLIVAALLLFFCFGALGSGAGGRPKKRRFAFWVGGYDHGSGANKALGNDQSSGAHSSDGGTGGGDGGGGGD